MKQNRLLENGGSIMKNIHILRKEIAGKYVVVIIVCIPVTAACCKTYLGPNLYSLLRVNATISKLTEKIDQWFSDVRMEK